jgi:AraC-like DNA-binding protein
MAGGGSVVHGIRLIRPAPVLEPFVRFYAHREVRLGDAQLVHPVHARAVPILNFEFGDADATLYVPSSGQPPVISPRTVLVGMQTGPSGELQIKGAVDSFVILLQPDALDLLFELPAEEFTDQSFDAESVLGHSMSRFYELLANCRSFGERVSVANRFFTRLALVARVRDGVSLAAHQILRRAGTARIPAMADWAGFSDRQFRRKFLQRVGMSPKLFARIARFEAVVDGLARAPLGSWTEIAHRFGYYDQMHMVHEFAKFTGETPTHSLRHFDVWFARQKNAIGSGAVPPSHKERWIL